MSKHKKNQHHKANEEKKAAADYYRLKTDAVEKLVNAKDAPEVSDEEIRKYTSKGKFHIPTAVKIMFLKFWFSGAACYFFLWGLGNYIADKLDLMVVLAVGMGIITDLMLNHILRSLETEQRANDKWMMVTLRKYWSIFLNVIYAGVLLFFVYKSYEVINHIFTDDPDETAVAVEPLLFGLLYMGFDMLFIAMKNTLVKIIKDAERKVSGGNK